MTDLRTAKDSGYYAATLLAGAVIAGACYVLSLLAPTSIRSFLDWLFSSLALPVLVVAVLAVSGVRRLIVGPARLQTLPAKKWWYVALVLGRLPLIHAVGFLLLAGLIAATAGTHARDTIGQALVLLVIAAGAAWLLLLTLGNAFLIRRHWSER